MAGEEDDNAGKDPKDNVIRPDFGDKWLFDQPPADPLFPELGAIVIPVDFREKYARVVLDNLRLEAKEGDPITTRAIAIVESIDAISREQNIRITFKLEQKLKAAGIEPSELDDSIRLYAVEAAKQIARAEALNGGQFNDAELGHRLSVEVDRLQLPERQSRIGDILKKGPKKPASETTPPQAEAPGAPPTDAAHQARIITDVAFGDEWVLATPGPLPSTTRVQQVDFSDEAIQQILLSIRAPQDEKTDPKLLRALDLMFKTNIETVDSAKWIVDLVDKKLHDAGIIDDQSTEQYRHAAQAAMVFTVCKLIAIREDFSGPIRDDKLPEAIVHALESIEPVKDIQTQIE